jgi:hypothetical protein
LYKYQRISRDKDANSVQASRSDSGFRRSDVSKGKSDAFVFDTPASFSTHRLDALNSQGQFISLGISGANDVNFFHLAFMPFFMFFKPSL